jgi:hypothetical protein
MHLEFRPPRQQHDLGRVPDRAWAFPDGTPWTRFFDLDDRLLLRFPDVADFEMRHATSTAQCTPVPGTHEDTLLHLWQNQVVPLVMSSQGQLVLHASAVSIGSVAVAFAGASMQGKSTLAAAFGLEGFPILTDDVLMLARGPCWQAYPGADSVRLRRDAYEAFFSTEPPEGPRKARLSHDHLPFRSGAQPLARLFFLARSDAPEPTLRVLPPTDAIVELVKHSFLLDVRSPDVLGHHFKQVTTLAAEVPCIRLEIPRNLASLPAVRSSIIRDLEKRRT